MIIAIHHVQITVAPDEETAARRFYCEVLGLPEVDKPDSLRGRGGFWVQLGAHQLHVGVESGVDRTRTKAHVDCDWDASLIVSPSVALPQTRRAGPAHGVSRRGSSSRAREGGDDPAVTASAWGSRFASERAS